MNRVFLIALTAGTAFLAGCASNQAAPAAHVGPQRIAVSTAQAVTRTVALSFEETGTFNADESSDIAPPVAGRVLATPVNVGDFVKQGQVVCELDHRDAELRLEQARAQLNEATSAVHQAESRIGLRGGSQFDANSVPEVAAARANYESAQAQARLAAADAKRLTRLADVQCVPRVVQTRRVLNCFTKIKFCVIPGRPLNKGSGMLQMSVANLSRDESRPQKGLFSRRPASAIHLRNSFPATVMKYSSGVWAMIRARESK